MSEVLNDSQVKGYGSRVDAKTETETTFRVPVSGDRCPFVCLLGIWGRRPFVLPFESQLGDSTTTVVEDNGLRVPAGDSTATVVSRGLADLQEHSQQKGELSE